MNNRLHTLQEACELVRAGTKLFVAGTEQVLERLPRGEWIGGTIPYFIDRSCGLKDTERVFVTVLPKEAIGARSVTYGVDDVARISTDAPEHGFTMLIVPAFGEVHRRFAENAPEFPDMFMKPVLGWISGVQLEDIGRMSPKVFLGRTGERFDNAAVAMHVTLDPSVSAKIDIVNLFHQGSGPVLRFPDTAFCASVCSIDGKDVNLARYVQDNHLDVRLPLVADFCGAMINTSIASVDADSGETKFYAPVFPGVAYRFADPIGDYATEFERRRPKDADMVFTCNCILNFLYGELEGKPLSGAAGPITFGEIAYQLLNQTMVYLELVKS